MIRSESNTALKFVIDRAKQAQVPKHVIDKAIDKAKRDETFTEAAMKLDQTVLC